SHQLGSYLFLSTKPLALNKGNNADIKVAIKNIVLLNSVVIDGVSVEPHAVIVPHKTAKTNVQDGAAKALTF
ncbi:hypothetical protein SGI36_21165, partial [Providencia rettgeri]